MSDNREMIVLNGEQIDELVRCKDCFHFHNGYVLPKHCALTGWATEPNDYCSSAEKRSDFYSIENDGTYSAGDGDEIQEPEDKDR